MGTQSIDAVVLVADDDREQLAPPALQRRRPVHHRAIELHRRTQHAGVRRHHAHDVPHAPGTAPRGIELRLDKASHDADRDARRLAELTPIEDRFLASVTRREPAEVESARVQDYRFALEEYRLSLFAQEVKTAMPVSVKRLDAMWLAIASS